MNLSTRSLKQRAISSGSWVLAGHVSSQGLRLVSNLILTRLLVPDMFGVMALVTVFMMGVGMFSDIGLQQNIVQSKKAEQLPYKNTAWTIQILRGFFIASILLVISWIFQQLADNGILAEGSSYADPRLPLIIAVMALVPVINGFRSINWLVLNRKLLMHRIVMIEMASQVISLVMMVVVAWQTESIWALVLGGVVSSLISTILSHSRSLGPKVSLMWDRASAHDIIHFGKWIFLSSTLGFLLSQGDKLMLGIWLTPELLGIYTIAAFIAAALKTTVNKVMNFVVYPVLSEVARERNKDLQRIYYELRLKVDFVAFSAAGFLFSTGHVLIDILYDSRYQQAGPILEVLSLSMIFVGYSMAGTCLLAIGQVKSTTLLIFIATIFMYLSVPIAFMLFGFDGAIYAVALVFFVDIPSTFLLMKKYSLLDVKKEFRVLPMLAVAYIFGELFKSLTGIV